MKTDSASTPLRWESLHEYGRTVVDGALRRGIAVEVVDPARGELLLTFRGRTLRTRESLCELTSAVALDRCQDKWAARRALAAGGCRLPKARLATRDDADLKFLAEVGALVAKPGRGAEGQDVFVDIRSESQLSMALRQFESVDRVILEEMHVGLEVRVLTIGFKAVAAILRTPPAVVGDGTHTVEELLNAQNRELRTMVGPDAGITIDQAVERALDSQGVGLASVPGVGSEVVVRRPTSLSADRRAGGRVDDVTGDLHHSIREAAEAASRSLEMPVLGLDMILKQVSEPSHVIIDANERPGLSNYAHQPVVDHFLELLFPDLKAVR